MAWCDKYRHDKACIARNWPDPEPDVVRLCRLMSDRRVQKAFYLGSDVGCHLVYSSSQSFARHGLDISVVGIEQSPTNWNVRVQRSV